MNTITLVVIDDMWHAHFSGPHADSIFGAFGCDIIPTPFTARTAYPVVVARIQELNPDAIVV